MSLRGSSRRNPIPPAASNVYHASGWDVFLFFSSAAMLKFAYVDKLGAAVYLFAGFDKNALEVQAK
ncbi:MAG: hypothetical protein ACREBD_11490 [Blastocatellia bacterium]